MPGDIFIGLGSNIGDAEDCFNRACEALTSSCKIIARSSLYKTRPYGYTDQSDFTNAAIAVDTDLDPDALLHTLQDIEKSLGKVVVCKNGPRCIDMDLLFFRDVVLSKPDIIIPHPEAHKRDFVLLPMQEIAPGYRHPLVKKNMQTLLDDLSVRYHRGNIQPWL